MDLYYSPASPPCRSVMMTAKAVGVKLNLVFLDVHNGDNLKPDFLKLNPQHCIPTLVDNDFSLWESRAIMVYLVQKYARNDALYPKNVKKRAIINQRMYFDAGTLFKSFHEYFIPKFLKNVDDAEKFKAVHSAVGFFNTFLEGHEYAANDAFSIADLSLLATVNTIEVVGFDFADYPNVARWLEHMKEIVKGYDECNEGLDIIRGMVAAHAHVGDPEPFVVNEEGADDSATAEEEKEPETEDAK